MFFSHSVTLLTHGYTQHTYTQVFTLTHTYTSTHYRPFTIGRDLLCVQYFRIREGKGGREMWKWEVFAIFWKLKIPYSKCYIDIIIL